MADYSALRSITIADVPAEYHGLVDAIGLDTFLELCRFFDGELVYIPKLASIKKAGRNREIRARFDGGNYRQLSAMFGLSGRYIRKIIDGDVKC